MEADTDKPWRFHTCQFCSYRSKYSSVMCQHETLHQTKSTTDTFICDSKTPEMFECEMCEFDTNLKVVLTEHARVFHEGKQANVEFDNIVQGSCCKSCDFETHSVLVLTKHATDCTISETDKQTHVFEYKRHYTISRKSNLELHHLLQKRTGNVKCTNWFQCAHCAYKCNRKGNLKTHILVKHTDAAWIKWFKCTECAFKSKMKAPLSLHVLAKHTNPENINWFMCTRCSFKSKQKSGLKAHFTRKHKGYKQQELLNHYPNKILVKHTNPDVDGFQCGQCGFRSKSKQGLTMHTFRKHKGIVEDTDRFKCLQCAYKCDVKVELQKHILLQHTNPEDTSWFIRTQCRNDNLKGVLKTHIIRERTNLKDLKRLNCTQHECTASIKTDTIEPFVRKYQTRSRTKSNEVHRSVESAEDVKGHKREVKSEK